MPEPYPRVGGPPRRLVMLLLGVITVVAFVASAWAPGPTTENYDENLWLQRSETFSAAILHGHFSRASATDPALGLTNPTMPGVTTMWAGVLGRQLARASGAIGLSAPISGPSMSSPQVLRASQTVISAMWAVLILLFMVLVRRLFSIRVALLSGGLLAVEPWAAGLAHLLHTDALVTMFSVTALCALAWSLDDRPTESLTDEQPNPSPQRIWIVVAALLAAGALLTKTNAIGLLGPGMACITWDAWRRNYRERTRELVGAASLGLGVLAVTSLAAWPALITSPVHQISAMLGASENVGRVRLRWFHGHLRAFIPQFYVVALAIRLTPWMLIACTTGAIGGAADMVRRILRRPTRPLGEQIPTWIVATPAIYLAVLSASRFGYDRYALAIVPFGAVAGSIVAIRIASRVRRLHHLAPTRIAALGVVALVAASLVPVSIAPYGTEFADPLIGGQRTSVRWIPVEGGKSSAELSQTLADHLDGRCSGVRVADAYWHPASDRCGTYFAPTTIAELRTADYAISFDVNTQGVAREWYRPWLVEHASLVARVELGGVPLGELWKIPRS